MESFFMYLVVFMVTIEALLAAVGDITVFWCRADLIGYLRACGCSRSWKVLKALLS